MPNPGDPYTKEANASYEEVMKLWRRYKTPGSGMTQADLDRELKKMALKNSLKVEKVKTVVPENIKKAAEVVGGEVVERGCPVENKED